MSTPSQVETTTRAGSVRGRVDGGVATYLGVPYAAPPVGGRRFAAPQPVESWTGVYEALAPGPSAPQHGSRRFAGIDVFPITGSEWRRGDSYLTLNLWAPADAENRPVMVFIPGGGLVLGTKDAAVYDGRNFARDGAVCVVINYRLGVEGFVPIPGALTNLGLRDMLAALRWVQDNIAAFGGDPRNVTLFGESGGGIAVACLLASPLSVGLFGQAIVQSGHGSAVYSLKVADRVVRRLAKDLQIAPNVDDFRSVPAGQLVAALARVSRPGSIDMKDDNGFDPSFGLGVVNPVYGDDVLPLHPLAALEAGTGRDVNLLIGTLEDEANFWFAPTRLLGIPVWAARLILRRLVPNADGLVDAYRRHDPRQKGGELLSRIITDLSFRWPARQFAAAHRGRTHVFEFDWDSDAARGKMGAAHGLDLGFVFDTLNTVRGPHGIAGSNPPQDLADYVHGTWTQFAVEGTVPWPEFEATTRVVARLFDRQVKTEQPLPASLFSPDP